jgi:hypothetical protein
MVILAVLGAVGYGVYSTLNHKPPVDPPEPVPVGWEADPAVQLVEQAPGPPQLLNGAAASPRAAGQTAPAPPYPSASLPAADAGEAPGFAPMPPAAMQSAAEAPPYSANPSAALPPEQPTTIESAPQGSPEFTPVQSQQQAVAQPPAAVQPPPSAMATPDAAQPPAGTEPREFATVPDANVTLPPAEPPVQNANPQPQVPAAGGSARLGTPQLPTSATSSVSLGALPQPSTVSFPESWQSIQQLLAQDRLVEAHRELSRWYGDPRAAQNEQQVQQLLDSLAGTIVYSRESFLEPAYEVQPGDTLQRIAEHYQVPWQLLAKINGIQDPSVLRTGEKLKVVRGPFSADVDIARFRLTLWLGDLYAGRFPIGIGADQTPPEGVFGVETKLENPTYYGPDQVVDANDPANPLGERWISLGNRLGIHGTTDPNSIGQAGARGCIRLSETDVNDVYDILSVGSRVTIRR